MVSIPRVGQGGTPLSTQAPAQPRSPSADSTFATTQAAAGANIAQLGEKMKDLNDLRDFTKAKTAASRAMLDITRMAEDDHTPWDMSAKYKGMLQESVDTAAGTLNNPTMIEQFRQTVGIDMLKTSYEISVLEKKAQLSEAKAVLEQNLELQHDRYYAAKTPQQREAIEIETKATVKAFVEKGGVFGEAANDMVKDQIEAMKVTAIDYDLQKNSVATIMELEKGENGKYKDTPASVRAEKMLEGEKILRHEKSVALLMNLVEMDKTDAEMIQAYRDHSLTPAMLEDSLLKGLEGKPGGMSKGVAS